MGAQILNRRPVGNPTNEFRRVMRKLTPEEADEVIRWQDRMFYSGLDQGFTAQQSQEVAEQSALKKAKQILSTSIRPVGNPINNVTDRALRYRANADPPAGPKVCRYCGSRRNVEIHHKDGDESNTARSNLAWACRSCNTEIGIEHARRGIGRRTRQYNPRGAPTIEQYIYAVKEHTRGAHDEGGKIIHATPKSKRREYAKKIWDARYSAGTDRPSRRATSDSEVPF